MKRIPDRSKLLAYLVATVTFLLYLKIDCHHKRSLQSHRHLSINRPFTETLPAKSICTDLLKLSISIQDEALDNLPPQYTLHSYINKIETDTEAMIAIPDTKNYVVIAFRGTEFTNINDWETNLNAKKIRSQIPNAPKRVKLHQGFWNATIGNSIATEFEEIILDLKEDGIHTIDNVYVTGHSMGGACAHILGAYLAAKNSDININVVTFGQPRIGNKKFKKWTERKLKNLSVFRFVNKNDIVPRLPYNFKHAGHLYQIWWDDSELYYNQLGRGAYTKVPLLWYSGVSVMDHFTDDYLDFFQNRVENDPSIWTNEFERNEECKKWQYGCVTMLQHGR